MRGARVLRSLRPLKSGFAGAGLALHHHETVAASGRQFSPSTSTGVDGPPVID